MLRWLLDRLQSLCRFRRKERRIFTKYWAWTGEVDALMFFGPTPVMKVVEITSAIWSFPHLNGPYLDPNREPYCQEQFSLSKYGKDGFELLYGVLKTHDGYDVPFRQYTLVDDYGLWIYAMPSVGSLPIFWKGEADLLEQLRELSEQVHRCYPIVAATYGFLTTVDVDIVMEAVVGKIPDERWAGICIWNGIESTYYPPTQAIRQP